MNTPPHPGHEGAGNRPYDDEADTDGLPAATSGEPAGSARAPVRVSDERRADAVATLDEPLDSGDLVARVHRPGLARSTRLLLTVLAVVALLALGTWIGRATVRRTGPGSMPDVVGTVESATGGANGQITVRAPDGTMTVFITTSGTKVAVASPGGIGGVEPGQNVTVSSQQDRLGGTEATLVQLRTP
ncbi:hypothetical protein LQ327_00980 [Actinomycetospora endophytica]|uniref:DUF5666 domain-containing protein n=1 Tax=Actinomycetospora endophytica TaxID=2291215 RepID=A0ABS8P134_9PSEU|nr:hypothetical protein [Actinomycetospora endophytica]MCD2191963.1 hypothetical protein [Actinomycetospora endophytica]